MTVYGDNHSPKSKFFPLILDFLLFSLILFPYKHTQNTVEYNT
jgi:hypothetical protein